MNHTCALFDNGNVRCWGNSFYYQLGLGTTSQNNLGDIPGELPTPPATLGGIAVDVQSGHDFSCALMATGGVRCWGQNHHGQTGHPGYAYLGDNETVASAGDVSLGAKALQISVGGWHACALLLGGSVRCWGYNQYGRLGIVSTADLGDDEVPSSVPPVDIGGTAVQVAAGRYSTCALLASGKVRCWGNNEYGQLGYQNTKDIGDNETPASAGDLKVLQPQETVLKVVLGGLHACVLIAGGTVRCWGNGIDGALGNGNEGYVGDAPGETAPLIATGAEVRELVLGNFRTCVLVDGGAVRCWGTGGLGQHGTGFTADIGDAPGEMPPQDAILYANP
ncbi:MAG: hypothetical protein IPJ59_00120 [Nannocystis sp.]|nr:hypothetical protein [Nannocystis sp.]MBK7823637.1 hypothetical protein [Nannocystis sp.]